MFPQLPIALSSYRISITIVHCLLLKMVAHLLLVAMVQAQVCGQQKRTWRKRTWPAETYCIGGSHTRTAEGVRQLCAVLGTRCHLTDGVWPDNASAPSLFNRMRVPSQWRHTYSHKAVGTTAAHFDAWGVISAQGTSTSREWVVVLEGDAMLNPLLSRRSAGARRSSLQSGSSGARSRVLGTMQQHAEAAKRHSFASRLLHRAPSSSKLSRGAHGGFVYEYPLHTGLRYSETCGQRFVMASNCMRSSRRVSATWTQTPFVRSTAL